MGVWQDWDVLITSLSRVDLQVCHEWVDQLHAWLILADTLSTQLIFQMVIMGLRYLKMLLSHVGQPLSMQDA